MGISSQISTLDEEISKAVQAQSVAGKQASKVRTFFDQRTFFANKKQIIALLLEMPFFCNLRNVFYQTAMTS